MRVTSRRVSTETHGRRRLHQEKAERISINYPPIIPVRAPGISRRHKKWIRMDNLRRRCYVTTRSDLDNFLSVCFCSLSVSFDLITRRGVGVMRTGAAPRIVFVTQAENWATTRSDLEFFIQNIEIIFKSCSLTCVVNAWKSSFKA